MKKKHIEKGNNNKSLLKKITLGFFFILSLVILYFAFTPSDENVLINGTKRILASVGFYTEEIKKVEIKAAGYDSRKEGSWHINKSANWIDFHKAQIRFDLDTVIMPRKRLKDVVLVFDVSGSMNGPKIEKVKEDTKELLEYLFSNSDNRVALIIFDSTSTIISEFTNDKEELINLVENIQVNSATNYNEALLNVSRVLNGYEYDENRDLITLFMTDGYPNKDTPNQVATYNILKAEYPFMVVNGIQYEMGQNIIQDIANISDFQFIANMNSLYNVLFDAVDNSYGYDSFEIVDYIEKDYWYVESESDIKVKKGHVKLEEENGVQKVIWSFDKDELRTGEKLSMTIDVKLKEQYEEAKGFYPTNEKETIKYKLPDEKEVKDTSDKTPVLKAMYKVIYDTNLPSNCGNKTKVEESHYVFENVTMQGKNLTCDGYIFKGWEIATQGVKKVNDDVFVMPSEDVTIRAEWSKPVISKSMNGEVKKGVTLYEQVELDFSDSSRYVKKYTSVKDTFIGDKDVYYYYGEAANNNVIFANYCWKIVRTTDTGGVKLLYNGVPSEGGSCDNTENASLLSLNQMPSTVKSVLVPFNSRYSTLEDVGYMYNSLYEYKTKEMTYEKSITTAGSGNEGYESTITLSLDIEENADGTFTLKNPVNVEKKNWSTDYSKYNKYYTCGDNATTCKEMKYIIGTRNSRITYEDVSKKYKYGNSFTYDSNTGLYTLVDTDKALIQNVWDWVNEYDDLIYNHYTCWNETGVCSSLSYIYYVDNNYDIPSYINLVNGKSIEDALVEILHSDDSNMYDSNIKTIVDYWYENNMVDYTKYLEDTYWCNERSSSIGSIGGWNPNGGKYLGAYSFRSNWVRDFLTCNNRADRFTVSLEYGNGKLKYPVGLITSQELYLAYAGNKSPLGSGVEYWTMTPDMFGSNFSFSYYAASDGKVDDSFTGRNTGVRPSISLIPNIIYTDGDGSVNNPYIIPTN